MEIHQRPGVYSDYTLSAAWSGTGSNRTVGIVGLYGSEKVTVVRTIDEAEEKFAGTDNLLSTVLMLLRSGAGSVTFCAAGGLDAEKYAAATEKLLLTEEVGLLVLDSESEEIQLAVKAVVENCSENGRECLAVFGTSEGDVEELTTMAAKFNSPRVVLMAHLRQEPMERIRWHVLRAFGVLPSEPRAREMTEGDYLYCAMQLMLDREEEQAHLCMECRDGADRCRICGKPLPKEMAVNGSFDESRFEELRNYG